MRGLWLMLSVSVLVGGMFACSDLEGEYFQNMINEVTTDHVAKRYGAPHRIEELEGNQSRWTYFKRGTSTVGYTGIAREEPCKAYMLTFDRHNVLRDWQQVPC